MRIMLLSLLFYYSIDDFLKISNFKLISILKSFLISFVIQTPWRNKESLLTVG